MVAVILSLPLNCCLNWLRSSWTPRMISTIMRLEAYSLFASERTQIRCQNLNPIYRLHSKFSKTKTAVQTTQERLYKWRWSVKIKDTHSHSYRSPLNVYFCLKESSLFHSNYWLQNNVTACIIRLLNSVPRLTFHALRNCSVAKPSLLRQQFCPLQSAQNPLSYYTIWHRIYVTAPIIIFHHAPGFLLGLRF